MADDIVARLRQMAKANGCEAGRGCSEAADEIERLRAAGDKLAQGVLDEHQPFLNDQHINLWWLAANWQEARRER